MPRDRATPDASKTGAGLAMLVTSVFSPVLSMIGYVATRIITQKKEGKSWSEVRADGERPLTGSIWLDALLFVLILVLIGAAVVGAMFWT